MKTEKVSCDGCGRDLATRTNSVDYRLVLVSESKPGHGPGAYTDMWIEPAIPRAHHFCDLRCLDHWRDRERHSQGLWREFWVKWKEEHATRRPDGRLLSYPEPAADLKAAKGDEFEASALAAFPMERPKR